MAIDRKRLDKLQFLSSCPNEIPHARIPDEFIRTIKNVDALAVYTLLRSKPPTHRWNTKWVEKELKDCGLGMCRERVEKAMALLNRSGWITYVGLKNERGENGGSIVQVHVSQLPSELRGKRRMISFSESGSFKIYDFDGQTELSKKDFNAGWTAQMKEGAEAGRASQGQEQETPLPRDPEHWVSGDQYKGDPKGEPLTPSGEGVPGVPLVEELGSEPRGPEPGVELLNSSSFPGIAVESAENDVVSPGCSVTRGTNWNEVREMARRSRETQEDRAAYHKFLVEVVYPALEDPPNRDKRWSATESVEWCRDSAKGQFVLSCAVEKEWPPDLAKAFRRTPSNCSISDIRLLLRTGVFAEGSQAELKSLIPSGKNPDRGETWKHMLERAKERDNHPKKVMERRIKDFPTRVSLNEKAKGNAWQNINMAKGRYCLWPEENSEDDQVFYGMLSVYYRPPDVFGWSAAQAWIEENRGDLSRRMAKFVASDRIAAAVALMDNIPATPIWGFEWKDVKREHVEVASELEMGAKLYDIQQSVAPDLELFAYEQDLHPAIRDGLLEISHQRKSRVG